MANKIKLAGTTSNNFQIGLQGVTLVSNRASSPYNLSLPANSGSVGQVIISNGAGNLDWSNSAINAQTVTENAQPNITSLGTLTSLSVSGNANVGNLGSGEGLFSGNVTIGSGSGGSLTGANLISANFIAGTLTTSSQPNITTIGTLANLSVTGNANVGNLGTAGLITATGNITGGNLSAAGSINAGTTVTITSSGTPAAAIGIGTGQSSGPGGVIRFAATGNIAYIQSGIYSTVSNSNAVLAFTTINAGTEWMRLDTSGNLGINTPSPTSKLHVVGTSNITGAAVFGSTISASGNANLGNIGATNGVFTNITGTLATAAQPNITSVGTLTSLSVSGNANVGNLGTAGLITATGAITSNANITSSNGFFISSNANLGYWLNISGNNVGKLYYNQGAVKVDAMDSTSNIQFGTNGSVRMSIFANGLTSVNGVLSVGSTLGVGGQANISGITLIGDYNQIAGSTSQLGIRFPGSSTRYGVGFYPNVDNTIIATFFNSSNTVLGTISQTSSNVTWNGLVNANGAITATGDITGSNLVSANYAIRSVTNSIAAAGSTQGAATALTKDINIVSSASTGANGVRLPTAVTGMVIYVINNTANTIQVYPATNGIIDSLAANAAFAMVANTRLQFAAATTTQWFSV